LAALLAGGLGVDFGGALDLGFSASEESSETSEGASEAASEPEPDADADSGTASSESSSDSAISKAFRARLWLTNVTHYDRKLS